MELTNFSNFRSDFLSDLESVDTLTLYTTPIDEAMTLEFKTLKDFFAYLSGVHVMEPIFGDINTFIKPEYITTSISYTFDEFRTLTTIDANVTFRFLPLSNSDESAIAYLDDRLYGEKNTYKPLGDLGTAILDSKITMTLQEAVEFFNTRFKNKYFKGSVTFVASEFFTKGSIIYISDRDFYIITTSFKNEKSGVYAYSGVLVVKG